MVAPPAGARLSPASRELLRGDLRDADALYDGRSRAVDVLGCDGRAQARLPRRELGSRGESRRDRLSLRRLRAPARSRRDRQRDGSDVAMVKLVALLSLVGCAVENPPSPAMSLDREL